MPLPYRAAFHPELAEDRPRCRPIRHPPRSFRPTRLPSPVLLHFRASERVAPRSPLHTPRRVLLPAACAASPGGRRRAADGRVWPRTGITNHIVLYLAAVVVIRGFVPDAASLFPHSPCVVLPPCFAQLVSRPVRLALAAGVLVSGHRATWRQTLQKTCQTSASGLGCSRAARIHRRPSSRFASVSLGIAQALLPYPSDTTAIQTPASY